MKVLLILAALSLFAVYAIAAPLPSQQPESSEFLDFVSKYDRVYGNPEERALRSRIFERNLAKIRAINSNPNYTWTAGVNHLADRSNDEMAKLKGYSRSMARSMMASSSIGPQDVPRLSPSQLPASVDWRDKGVVTPVKNQGGCGSCWAFSTAETMESAVAIASGQLLEFSEQQLVDCAPNPNHCGGTGGCAGSVQEVGMNYSKSAGITTEKDYPYTAETGTCQPDKIKPVATIDGYVKLPTNDYDALMSAVATIGPIAISVAADWAFYLGGVYNGECGWVIDHAVQLVGYGVERTIFGERAYWLVRNSWGGAWGDRGYIKIHRETDASKVACGIDHDPQAGDGCDGGPSTVKVCGKCGILSDSSYPVGARLLKN